MLRLHLPWRTLVVMQLRLLQVLPVSNGRSLEEWPRHGMHPLENAYSRWSLMQTRPLKQMTHLLLLLATDRYRARPPS